MSHIACFLAGFAIGIIYMGYKVIAKEMEGE